MDDGDIRMTGVGVRATAERVSVDFIDAGQGFSMSPEAALELAEALLAAAEAAVAGRAPEVMQ